MAQRFIAPLVVLLAMAVVAAPPRAQTPSGTPNSSANPLRPNDIELVEKLLVVRRDYQKTLETLRLHYIQAGDVERAKWAEEELIQFHRINKQAYVLDLDVPPPGLKASKNIPEANTLYTEAVRWKSRSGFGNSSFLSLSSTCTLISLSILPCERSKPMTSRRK